ncbi:DUF5518 domain-containing protein [Halopiger djelfimassiliensis]|uniref:DUF5518 domain-containing protein n=1 Tax=Halopiger djelfimassiliensis TaxID=1293047 RepID=UPI000677C843|nr:DUF5518 domain-containing protein [Halopiger djelfimassiliensis]
MSPLQNVRHDLRDGQFRTAIYLGLALLPLAIGGGWILNSDPVWSIPLFVACVFSGYLYRDRSEKSARAGAVTAVVGGAPILVWRTGTTVLELWNYPELVDAVGDRRLMALLSAGAAVTTFVILALTLLVIGQLGGFVGGWMSARLEGAEKSDPEA